MRKPSVLFVLVLSLALSLSGCSRYARRGAAPPATEGPVSYGDNSKLPTNPTARPAASKKGTIVVQISDDKGRALPGAIARVKGPKTFSKATDRSGKARFTVPPGRYVVDVAPCGSTVITDSHDSGTADVGAGQTIEAPLQGIEWHLRYRPEAAVALSRRPPWQVGSEATLRVRVADGCDISKTASGVSMASYTWKASANFRILSAATRADRQGYLPITVRCVSAGNGSIVIRNRFDPPDQVDLLAAASGPPSGKRWCE